MIFQNERFMQVALNLAKKHNGITASNPSVGCVITKDGKIISTSTTAVSGRPHAESVALSLNYDFTGSSMFVTLEPCSHFGKTSPCVEKIIKAGIKQVFIGMQDPDARVNGIGIETLKKAGIEVFCGLLEAEVKQFYKPYVFFKTNKRPFVTGKIACSMDGKIATFSHESKWITSPLQNTFTNFLRYKYNGILVGGNTYREDSPKLTCRIEGLEDFSPIRFILSSTIKKAEGFNIVKGNLTDVLHEMHVKFGVNHLLVEGGANIITSFIEQGLINELMLVQAPMLIGQDGKNCFQKTGINLLVNAHHFSLTETFECGGGIINILNKL